MNRLQFIFLGIFLFLMCYPGSSLAQVTGDNQGIDNWQTRHEKAVGSQINAPESQTTFIVPRSEISLFGGAVLPNNTTPNWEGPPGTTSNEVNSWGIGFGGGLRVIFPVDSYLGFGGSVSCQKYNGLDTIPGLYVQSEERICYEILGTVKINIGNDRSFYPYVLGGLGMCVDYEAALGSGTEIHPMVQLGGGLEISVGRDISFFVEAKESLVVEIAISLGPTGGGSDSSFTYTPLDAGIAFNL